MKLIIASVGSSSLIAEEIRDILNALLGERISVITCLTRDITADDLADLYVCARTQYPLLTHIIPAEKLFLMELQPPSTFFWDIAKIPAGSDVYIMNNYLEYPTILADYCRSLGLDKLHYIPLAFEEMEPVELSAALRQARYIIGVDRFVNLLLDAPYSAMLQPGVKIIAGKRTASLHSAFAVIRSIGQLMLQSAEKRCADLALLDANDLRQLLMDINDAIDLLQSATIRSVVSQATLKKPQAGETVQDNTAAVRHIASEGQDDLTAYTMGRLQMLRILQTKLCMLKK